VSFEDLVVGVFVFVFPSSFVVFVLVLVLLFDSILLLAVVALLLFFLFFKGGVGVETGTGEAGAVDVDIDAEVERRDREDLLPPRASLTTAIVAVGTAASSTTGSPFPALFLFSCKVGAAGINDVEAERRARDVRLRPCVAPPERAAPALVASNKSISFTLETTTGCFAPVLFH